MTTDWSKTWGADWYDGYKSTNKGSFVDISKLSGSERDKAITSAQENIIGLLEQKGVTRAQILDPTSDVGKFYKTTLADATAGGDTATRDAFQAAAYHTTSATDRGDKWGADTDHTMGRTFLENVSSDTTIDDLYTKGFGREADEAGKAYWAAELASGRHTIESIAKEFGRSEEAQIRDVYSDEYGRDVRDEGLTYWRDHAIDTDGAAALKKSLVQQDETAIRYLGHELMGQSSSKAQRATKTADDPFTDMETDQVIDWIGKIRAGTMTLDDVKDVLVDRADRMDAHNKMDKDDWDGDGAQPTGMGRFASLAEIQATIDSGESADDIRKRLAKTKWASLTHEKEKQWDDERTTEDWTKYGDSVWNVWKDKTAPKKGTPQDDWTPNIPTKPAIPKKTPVDRSQIEYMPGVDADKVSSTPYESAQKEFKAEQDKVSTKPSLDSPTVAQRFTGTSAKGVALKRSKRSQIGTIRGTKQLGRTEQLKSLNL